MSLKITIASNSTSTTQVHQQLTLAPAAVVVVVAAVHVQGRDKLTYDNSHQTRQMIVLHPGSATTAS
jgi:hypothetical protein